jgi:hypothetical protein
MSAHDDLSETVVFEVLNRTRAEWLGRRLGSRWLAAMSEDDEGTVVAVGLRPEEGDLAALLRVVEEWVADSGLGAIRYHLDGRAYVLDSWVATSRPVAA